MSDTLVVKLKPRPLTEREQWTADWNAYVARTPGLSLRSITRRPPPCVWERKP